MKYKDLPNNNKFCMRPWRGAHIMPDGDVVACCHQTYGHWGKKDYDIKHNLKNSDIGTIRNSPEWNQLRKDLVNGVQNEACEYCWRLEDKGLSSMRTRGNEMDHGWIIEDIDINLDGTLADNKVSYWDIRDSNLCNMKCIMCGPGLSSLWNQEALDNFDNKETGYNVKNPIGDKALFHVNDVSREPIESIIERHIDHAQAFYFAGGEPLINDTHWRIIEMLEERKMFNTRLAYNTNLLKLKYKKWNAAEAWKKFPNLSIGASIDAVGYRAEYTRTGTVWNLLEDNFAKGMEINPWAMGISATVNIMTIGGMADLMKWVGKMQVRQNKFIYHNVLVSPSYLNINILPMEVREQLWKPIQETIDTWDPKWKHIITGTSLKVLKEKFFNDVPDEEYCIAQRKQFKSKIQQLDRVRGTNILDACPELEDFWNSI